VSTVPPQPPFTQPPVPQWPPVAPAAQKRSAGRRAITALAVALLALGVAIGSWFRLVPDNKSTDPPPKPIYTDQQVALAKTDICSAYRQVRRALDAAGARNGGSDSTANLAVATASRQALDVGSRYLLIKLAEQPATNPALAVAVRKLADLYLQITVSYLANASDSEIDPLFQTVDQSTSTIDGLCK
jgi:hypothetical protein